jgi:hypothetical protein
VAAASDIVRVSKQAQLGIAFATIYTVNYQRQFTASCIHLVNTTGGAVTVQLTAAGPGIAPATANALLWSFSIPANDFLEFGEGLILFSQWVVSGLASAPNAITAIVCGIEN